MSEPMLQTFDQKSQFVISLSGDCVIGLEMINTVTFLAQPGHFSGAKFNLELLVEQQSQILHLMITAFQIGKECPNKGPPEVSRQGHH
jgi:hypothetical protein